MRDDLAMVKLSFYGGVGEIGGNKILLEADDTRIFLDFGLSYGREDDYFEFPLLRPACIDDLFKTNILPRICGLYKNGGLSVSYGDEGTPSVCGTPEECAIDGVLLTHAHMDHYGYLGMIRPDIPIYLSQITRRLIELRNDARSDWQTDVNLESLRTVEQSIPFSIGNLKVRRFDVDHSVPGASAYLIQAGDKIIAYTGDLRFHGNNREASEAFLQACKNTKVDILLCEGTRLGPPKTDDEQQAESHALGAEAEVEQKCRDILSREDGLVIYDASPADMNRIKIVCRAAAAFGRTPVFDSRKAYLLLYLNHPDVLYPGLPKAGEFKIALSRIKQRGDKCEDFGLPADLYTEAYTEYRQGPEAKLLTAQKPAKKGNGDNSNGLLPLPDDTFFWGSQREEVLQHPERYLLYTSNGPNTLLQFLPADGRKINGTYIYGKAEPFEEEMELSFARLRHWLDLCGLKLEYAHTSGHMHQPDVVRFVSEINAKVVIPIHTEHPTLFRQWANDVRIVQYGETLEFL